VHSDGAAEVSSRDHRGITSFVQVSVFVTASAVHRVVVALRLKAQKQQSDLRDRAINRTSGQGLLSKFPL